MVHVGVVIGIDLAWERHPSVVVCTINNNINTKIITINNNNYSFLTSKKNRFAILATNWPVFVDWLPKRQQTLFFHDFRKLKHVGEVGVFVEVQLWCEVVEISWCEDLNEF